VLAEGVAGDELTTQRLQDHVKATIAPYKYPRSVKFIDALPKTRPARSSAFG
jgi:2-aminobenzoate-CoA ligase